MIRMSKASKSIREEMSQTESISWIICLKTTLEFRVEQASASVFPDVDYVTIQSTNQGGTVGVYPAPFGVGVLFFCRKIKGGTRNGENYFKRRFCQGISERYYS